MHPPHVRTRFDAPASDAPASGRPDALESDSARAGPPPNTAPPPPPPPPSPCVNRPRPRALRRRRSRPRHRARRAQLPRHALLNGTTNNPPSANRTPSIRNGQFLFLKGAAYGVPKSQKRGYK